MHQLCKIMHAALPEATAEAFNNIFFFHNQKQSLQYISLEASKYHFCCVWHFWSTKTFSCAIHAVLKGGKEKEMDF